MAAGRRYKRVSEALGGLAKDLKNFKNEASELYVKTEDFEDLLGKTLWEVAEERHEEKRRVYRAFLSISSPRQDNLTMTKSAFCARWSFLQPDHFRILKALRAQPEGAMEYRVSLQIEWRSASMRPPKHLVRQTVLLVMTSTMII